MSTTLNAPAILTDRQMEVLKYVAECIGRGLPPTIREIGEELGILSPNGVMCHLKALEKKGMIQRVGDVSRSIFLTDAGRAITGTQTWTSKTAKPTAEQLGQFTLENLQAMAVAAKVAVTNSKNLLAIALAESGRCRVTSELILA